MIGFSTIIILFIPFFLWSDVNVTPRDGSVSIFGGKAEERIFKDGHSYLKFRNSDTGELQVIHDWDCSCNKVDYKLFPPKIELTEHKYINSRNDIYIHDPKCCQLEYDFYLKASPENGKIVIRFFYGKPPD